MCHLMNEAQRESIPIVDARLLQHFDVVRHLTLFSLFPDQHLGKGLTLAADLRLWQMKRSSPRLQSRSEHLLP